MSVKFLVLGGGGEIGFWRGGSADYIFIGALMGARIFLRRTGPSITSQKRVKDEMVYKPHFSPEFGDFSLGLVAHPCGDPNRATQCRE